MINKKKNLAIKAILIFILMIIGLVVAKKSASFENSGVRNSYILVCMTIIVLIVWSELYEKINIYNAIVLIAILSLPFLLILPVYSPIDEAAHFAYINYIIKNGSLPLINEPMKYEYINGVKTIAGSVKAIFPEGMPFYEAVHPPVYYLLMAILTFWIKSLSVRFWIYRFIGEVFLVLSAFYVIKSFQLLHKRKYIKDLKPCLWLCVFVFTMPGIITRMICLSNEALATLVVTIVIYSLIKCVFNEINTKMFIGTSVLIILSFLIKVTTAYLFVVWFILLLLKNKHTKAGLLIVISCAGTFPYFLYNYLEYGTLTGSKLHIDIVKPIVNPNNKIFDIPSRILEFFRYFFQPQDLNLYRFEINLIIFVSILLIIIILIFALKVAEGWINFFKTKEKINEEFILNNTIILLILGNMSILLLSSMLTRIDIIIGRYMYLSIIPLIYVVYKSTEKNISKVKVYLTSGFFIYSYLVGGLLFGYEVLKNTFHNLIK